MRALVALVPLALIAAPASAETPKGEWPMPAELFDPSMADKLAKMMGAMTRAMMDMPVGEMQAAVEGRQPSDADKRRTIRDLAGRDPDFDRRIQQQVALAVPRMQAGMRAMAASMPAMMAAIEKAAEEMEREVDRATANVPQPGYPKR